MPCEAREKRKRFKVTIAQGLHLFPFRTEKLNLDCADGTAKAGEQVIAVLHREAGLQKPAFFYILTQRQTSLFGKERPTPKSDSAPKGLQSKSPQKRSAPEAQRPESRALLCAPKGSESDRPRKPTQKQSALNELCS